MNRKKVRKILALLLAFVLMFGTISNGNTVLAIETNSTDTTSDIVEDTNAEAEKITVTFIDEMNDNKITVDLVADDTLGGNLPSEPSYDGYTFIGWYEDGNLANCKATTETVISESITFKAVWEENETSNGVTLESVQALIDALPDAISITANNADEVSNQLDAIDDAKAELYANGGNPDELDYTLYDAACAALEALANVETSTPTLTATAYSGTCGDNLTWELDDEGTLTISGTGDMTEYSNTSSTPWSYKY